MIIIGIIICIILCLLLIIGLIWGKYCRDEYGVYDPLYKTWFDYSELDYEQQSRIVKGSNKLRVPSKDTMKRTPLWKEKAPVWLKTIRFILYGNKPRPYNLKDDAQ